MRWCLSGLVALAAALAGSGAEGDAVTSESGELVASFTSDLVPLPINRMHTWVVRIEPRSGEPVEGARIAVSGGMPAHDHGLPTRPRVTRSLGDGAYLLEGLRFHMNGQWEVRLDIDVEGISDAVVFRFSV